MSHLKNTLVGVLLYPQVEGALAALREHFPAGKDKKQDVFEYVARHEVVRRVRMDTEVSLSKLIALLLMRRPYWYKSASCFKPKERESKLIGVQSLLIMLHDRAMPGIDFTWWTPSVQGMMLPPPPAAPPAPPASDSIDVDGLLEETILAKERERETGFDPEEDERMSEILTTLSENTQPGTETPSRIDITDNASTVAGGIDDLTLNSTSATTTLLSEAPSTEAPISLYDTRLRTVQEEQTPLLLDQIETHVAPKLDINTNLNALDSVLNLYSAKETPMETDTAVVHVPVLEDEEKKRRMALLAENAKRRKAELAAAVAKVEARKKAEEMPVMLQEAPAVSMTDDQITDISEESGVVALQQLSDLSTEVERSLQRQHAESIEVFDLEMAVPTDQESLERVMQRPRRTVKRKQKGGKAGPLKKCVLKPVVEEHCTEGSAGIDEDEMLRRSVAVEDDEEEEMRTMENNPEENDTAWYDNTVPENYSPECGALDMSRYDEDGHRIPRYVPEDSLEVEDISFAETDNYSTVPAELGDGEEPPAAFAVAADVLEKLTEPETEALTKYQAVLVPATTNAMCVMSKHDPNLGICYGLLGDCPVTCTVAKSTAENIKSAMRLLELQHPNIIQPLACYALTNHTLMYMQMSHGCALEYVPYEALRLMQFSLPEVAAQAIAGIHHLHSRDIVHNAISSLTIFLTLKRRLIHVKVGGITFFAKDNILNEDTTVQNPGFINDIKRYAEVVENLYDRTHCTMPEPIKQLLKKCNRSTPSKIPDALRIYTSLHHFYTHYKHHAIAVPHNVAFDLVTPIALKASRTVAVNVLVPEAPSDGVKRICDMENDVFKNDYRGAFQPYDRKDYVHQQPFDYSPREITGYSIPKAYSGEVSVLTNTNGVALLTIHCLHGTNEGPKVFMVKEGDERVILRPVAICYQSRAVSWGSTILNDWCYPIMKMGMHAHIRPIYSYHIGRKEENLYEGVIVSCSAGVPLRRVMNGRLDRTKLTAWCAQLAWAFCHMEEKMSAKYSEVLYGVNMSDVYVKDGKILVNLFGPNNKKDFKKENAKLMLDVLLLAATGGKNKVYKDTESDKDALTSFLGSNVWETLRTKESVKRVHAHFKETAREIYNVDPRLMPGFTNQDKVAGLHFLFRNEQNHTLQLFKSFATACFKA
ncbi:ORF107 [Ranid herpesvirus 2]|uniref:ORF107 n=1 Tax=Ranid herpesvirus 2 TaxID=389214 RepID=Q14VZ9_9VIRU|nr:ORF107 [Ranid herpesvirus 2]ABG25581.1 ORF107 [Ranid herpesvirus 2]